MLEKRDRRRKQCQERFRIPGAHANGSAKIALIAMERSLSAWDVIRNLLPETTDDMLDLLVVISKLRSGLQRIFPKTHLFIRPGFDELGEARSDS